MMRPPVPAIAALAAVFAISTACSGSGGDRPDPHAPTAVSAVLPASCVPSKPSPPGDYGFTLRLASADDRRYVVHVPPAYDGSTALPVVLGLPAAQLTPEAFAGFTGLPSSADANAFLLVVLTAGSRGWDVAGDDLSFAREVLDRVGSDYCADTARVYAAGYSDGGSMAQALACAEPDRIAAIGLVSATYLACRAPVPLIAFHGLADTLVPFEGSEATGATAGTFSPNVRRAVSEWAKALDCDALATISRPSSEVEMSTYRRCRKGDGEAVLYSIVGGGHTWPGHPSEITQLGFTTAQIDATQSIWDFFAAHALSSS